MYRILDQINDFIDASSPVLYGMVISDGMYPDRTNRGYPAPIVNEIHDSYNKMRKRIIEGLNLNILGLSGNVFVITEAEKYYLADQVYFKISNGVEWIARQGLGMKDSHVSLNLYDPNEVMNSTDDYVFIRWVDASPDSKTGFKYHLARRDVISSGERSTYFTTHEEIELVDRCCKLGQENRMSNIKVGCPHCGIYNYICSLEGPIVFLCLRCGKLFVYEKNARALNIDPTLGRPNWMNNKTRWNHIEIDGV